MQRKRFQNESRIRDRWVVLLCACVAFIAIDSKTARAEPTLGSVLCARPESELATLAARSAMARYESSRGGPDAQLNIDFENFAGSGAYSGADSSEATVLLGRTFDLSGHHQKISDIAKLEAELASLEVRHVRAHLWSDFVNAQYNLRDQQLRLEIHETYLRELDALAPSVRGKHAASLAKLRSQAEADRRAGQANSRTEEIRFQNVWGGSDIDVSPADSWKPLPSLDDLLALSDEAIWSEVIRTRLEIARSMGDAQSRSRVPKVWLGAGYRRIAETDDNAALLSFSVPLPLSDRYRHDADAIAFDRQEAEIRARLERATHRKELVDIHARLSGLDAHLRELEAKALPEVLERVGAALRDASGTPRDVEAWFDARSELLRLRLEVQEVEWQRAAAAVDLSRLLISATDARLRCADDPR